ncbi:MAG: hypothetical protein H6963_13850 [Chromatiaceae bacterium]|nr:hypothetical protein [Chromatiaceae bacterium]
MATLIIKNVFVPVVGNCYEIHYGEIRINGKTGFCTAKIKANGSDASQWIDLDTGSTLDPEIAKYVVKAYSDIACPKL